MKAYPQKVRSKAVHSRKYKKFVIMAELMSYLSVERFGINSCERFLYICNNGLNKHAPQKKKIM